MLKVFLDIVFHWKWFNEISDNNKKKKPLFEQHNHDGVQGPQL